MKRTHTLTALVENKPGVLNRVVSLFRRRGFNIDSLTVGRTHTPEISRMTIVMEGDDLEAQKVEKNLYKLVNVIHVEQLTEKQTVMRDLALIKVSVDGARRHEVTQLCDIFRAKIVDVSPDSLIVEITGTEDKIDTFTEMLRPIGIVEMVRAGVIAMGRGGEALSANGYQARLQALAAAGKNLKSVV